MGVLALALAACQEEVETPPLPVATGDRVAAPTVIPTRAATPMVTVVPTRTATPAAATPTPTVAPTRAAIPTPTVTSIIVGGDTPAPPQPTPTPAAAPTATLASPALEQVPPTDGAVRVQPMPSRNHFPKTMRIGDVVSGGYSTIPPTSGQHWGEWSDCGFYYHPLPDELLVHNLEHGNIIVSYNLPDDADVAALRAAVEAIPLAQEFAIVRRYLAIPEGMVAITTWGVLDRMMGVDPERIARFFADYPGNTGPEFANGLPCTTGVSMTPSSSG